MPSIEEAVKNTRPLSVTIIGWVYIGVGATGFVYHSTEFSRRPFQFEIVWIELVRLLAVVSGVYLLRGHNWARWLALAWIGAHVILSAFNSLSQLAIHVVFFAILTFFLMRSTANRYFGTARP
jgi:hypothetical protein